METKKYLNLVVACLIVGLFGFHSAVAQQSKEERKDLQLTQQLLHDAEASLQDDEFAIAEAAYRKAIAIRPENETGKYNLGTAYYGKAKNAEAMERFKQAAAVAQSKSEKHKAFHNLGNTYMNEKNYQAAVEAYKNALRNNPTDDETRYNLALAKDLLEKNPPKSDGGGDDENEDQNEDKKDEQNQENQDDKGEQQEGDQGDDEENKDQGDQKDENKEGDQKDEGKPDNPKDQEGDQKQPQQPQPGQLSPQQVKSLLEAMNNEEKKVQDKINAQKQKGAKVISEKDW
jgi:tetratricopeptide (TPR) repeat protein